MSRHLVAIVWLLACPAIATAQTHVDYDHQANFTLYKTFAVEVAPPVLADGVKDVSNTLSENRLRDAVTRELQARGLEPTDVAADLTIQVSSRETERTGISSSSWGAYPWGWYGGGYWGFSYGAWGFPYSADVWSYNYLEGTVTISVIDSDTHQLVYRARVSDEIGKHLDREANKAVHRAFRKFPIKEIELDD